MKLFKVLSFDVQCGDVEVLVFTGTEAECKKFKSDHEFDCDGLVYRIDLVNVDED